MEEATAAGAAITPSSAPQIPRDAILNLLNRFFDEGFAIVSVEGKPDIGKTQLLKQFHKTCFNNSVGLFLQPQSWFLNDPNLFYVEIAAQMCACLGVETPASSDTVDEAIVRRLLLEVHRRAQKKRQQFYLIVDGLEDVLDDATSLISALIGILPLEFSTFRFLFSGDLSWVPARTLSSTRHRSYPVPGFTLEETGKFFAGLALTQAEVEEFYRSLGNGTPGYLASARRLLDGGVSAQDLQSKLHSVLPSPFQLEWLTVRGLSEEHQDALAILAFDSTAHPLKELAAIIEADAEKLYGALTGCTFLRMPADVHSEARFVSASFRNFAGEQLLPRRNKVWAKLAHHFLRVKETERALELPSRKRVNRAIS